MNERELLGENVILQFCPLAPAQPVNIVCGKGHLVRIFAVVLRESHLIKVLPFVLIAAVQNEVIFPPRPLAGLAVTKGVCRDNGFRCWDGQPCNRLPAKGRRFGGSPPRSFERERDIYRTFLFPVHTHIVSTPFLNVQVQNALGTFSCSIASHPRLLRRVFGPLAMMFSHVTAQPCGT